MYHPAIVAKRRELVEATFRETFPRGLREYPVAEVKGYRERLSTLWDRKGKQVRELDSEEQAYIANEQVLTKIHYRYWAERYSTINIAGQALGPMFPLLESQGLILDEIGRIERERVESGHPDGVLFLVVKARQLGCSTLMSSLIAHRSTTHAHTLGLVASDVPDSSAFLFDMYERNIDHLPWYLRPTIAERVKNDEIVYGTGSHVFVGASKSTRGGQEGKRGQIGRGKTLSVVHLSEVSTWEAASQNIDTALLPAVPMSPRTLVGMESTCKGKGPQNYWHQAWVTAKNGLGRFTPIFIPWFAERMKYRLPPPPGWAPNTETLAMAQRAETYGPRWLHRPVTLTRDQLYWWEHTRAEFKLKGRLADFMEEYPSDDEEAFQHSGRSVFDVEVRERVRAMAKPYRVLDVKSFRDLTRLEPLPR